MIAFFRRYQRAIYIVVTIVIIISFSFFGTYSASTRRSSGEDPVIATLVDGRKVYRSECNQYVQFLSTDPLTSADGSGNPLNDGFIATDILGTPFGEALVTQCSQAMEEELRQKLAKEKRFIPYQHPQAPFLSAVNVWTYFAPELRDGLSRYQRTSAEAKLEEIFANKKALYLSERAFPSFYLRQVLSYQQKQYSWLEPDVTLDNRPLNLFGYNSLQDWFGCDFVDMCVVAIMNTARIAEREGFSVSYDEAKAQLYKNAKVFLERYSRGSQAQVEELINRVLASYAMEEHEAVAIMKDLLLFRRAVTEIPSHVITASRPYKEFLREGNRVVACTKYLLPEHLQARSLRDLLKIQFWIDTVSDKDALGPQGLDLPQQFKSPEEVLKSNPELVEKRFLVSLVQVSQDELFDSIRLKDIWQWLESDENWAKITAEQPALLEYAANSPSERIQILERLSGSIRRSVDESIRKKMIASRSEVVDTLLAQKKPSTEVISIRFKGGNDPLQGIQDRIAFSNLLSQAVIGEKDEMLHRYSQDGVNFYRIVVLDRSSGLEIIPLKAAVQEGILDQVFDQSLEAAYQRAQRNREKEFQKEDGSWRDFQEVKDDIMERTWLPFIKKLSLAADTWKEKLPGYFPEDEIEGAYIREIRVRFLSYLNTVREKAERHEDIEQYIQVASMSGSSEDDGNAQTSVYDFQPTPQHLESGWSLRLVPSSLYFKDVSRSSGSSALKEMFQLPVGAVTEPYFDVQEASPSFVISKEKSEGSSSGVVFETLSLMGSFIGEEAMAERSHSLIDEMVSKDALPVSKPL